MTILYLRPFLSFGVTLPPLWTIEFLTSLAVTNIGEVHILPNNLSPNIDMNVELKSPLFTRNFLSSNSDNTRNY